MLVDSIGDSSAGAERFAVGLAGALAPDRYAVTVCATRYATGRLPATMAAAGIRVLSLGRGTDFKPHAFGRLMRYLRRERVDVLHAHKFGSNVWGTVIGRLSGVPVILAHEHSWAYEGDPVRLLLDRYLIGRGASAFVAVSTLDAARMVAVEKVPAEKVVTIPNAYLPRPREPVVADLRAELGLEKDAPLLVTGAILRAEKGLDVLIDAFAQVVQQLPRVHLVIAGKGPCEAELKRDAAVAGVADRVHFLGFRSDMDVILESSDLAVMSSDREGLPLFAIECMAHRTPLVATDVGGIRDILVENESVLLAPRRDPSALARQIERALLEPERRDALAAAAHARLGELTIDRIADRFEALYERLLERGAPGVSTPLPVDAR